MWSMNSAPILTCTHEKSVETDLWSSDQRLLRTSLLAPRTCKISALSIVPKRCLQKENLLASLCASPLDESEMLTALQPNFIALQTSEWRIALSPEKSTLAERDAAEPNESLQHLYDGVTGEEGGGTAYSGSCHPGLLRGFKGTRICAIIHHLS